ncbi:MAG: hypothetical protein GTO41_24295 [Burkholderiales bacterium]|nr:hypothetical protein [Burkholderiales bacterium]
MDKLVQKNRSRVNIVLDIEAGINKNALVWGIEGLDATGPLTKLVLQFSRGNLMHLGVNLGHWVSANIMNCNE